MAQQRLLGDFLISRVVEHEGPFASASVVIAGFDEDRIKDHEDWIRPHYLTPDNELIMAFQSYVIQTPTANILIDTCVGQDKPRPSRASWHMQQQPRYLAELQSLGLGMDDIDYVFCTHMHADHVGWNTVLDNGRWVPTFKNAKYLFGKEEYAHWHEAHQLSLSTPTPSPNHGSFEDSVLPVVESGQAQMVESDFEIEAGLYLGAAFGHTPGTCVLHANSKDQRALFAGDIFHSPVQLVDLGWSSRFCSDPVAAAEVRQAVTHAICDSNTLLFAGHFPNCLGGHVRRGERTPSSAESFVFKATD